MTKSELITLIAEKQAHLSRQDVDAAINCIIEQLTSAITQGQRVEIRGFGSFTRVERQPRIGRNPKTGESIPIASRCAYRFKPGLDLRDRVNASRLAYPKILDD